MEADKLYGKTGESKAMAAVRTGLNLKPEFWDDFIQVLGNAEGLAELLDVSREKITGWAGKIRDILDQVQKSDDEESKNQKAEFVPTGDEEGIANPNGHPDHIEDLRPTP
jgi:hypothetical protein